MRGRRDVGHTDLSLGAASGCQKRTCGGAVGLAKFFAVAPDVSSVPRELVLVVDVVRGVDVGSNRTRKCIAGLGGHEVLLLGVPGHVAERNA